MNLEIDLHKLENIFTISQCLKLVKLCKNELKFSFWNEDKLNNMYRSSETIELLHPGISITIYKAIRRFIPFEIMIQKTDKKEHILASGVWKLSTIEDQLLIARYRKLNHFSPHTDGNQVVDFNHRSLYSIIIYLIDSIEGGTKFYLKNSVDQLKKVSEKWKISEKFEICCLESSLGQCIIFRQIEFHEGSEIKSELCKYIIRLDIIYEKNPLKYVDQKGKKSWKHFCKYEKEEYKKKNNNSIRSYELCRQICIELAEDCWLY